MSFWETEEGLEPEEGEGVKLVVVEVVSLLLLASFL